MSKTFESKKKILDLLKQGATTPTNISRQLGLSPSTVSQHLKELKETGRIEEFQDEHFKNIKYYRRLKNPSILNSGALKYATVVLAIAILALLFMPFRSQGTVAVTYPNRTNSVGIFLTDPPQVPSGTQALVVSYSSLKIQVTNRSGTFWDSVNGSGSVNLLSLVNFSKDVASFNLPSNSIVDKLSLNITNASITVNGTTYPVVVSDKSIAVKVFQSSQNNTPFDILFDMFPTVSAVISGNETVFIMSPSATAAAIVKANNPYYQQQVLGARGVYSGQALGLVRLSKQEQMELNQSRSKITITGASINTSGNQTSISISVLDNSNQSTTLLGVVIYGNESYALNLNFSDNETRSMMPNINVPYITTNPDPNTTRWPQGAGIRVNASANANFTPSSAYVQGPIPNPVGQEGGYGSRQGSLSIRGVLHQQNISLRLNNSVTDVLMQNLSNVAVEARINGIIRAIGFVNLSTNQTGNAIFGHIIEDINLANYVRSRLDTFKMLNLFAAQNGTLLLPMPQMMHWHGVAVGHYHGGRGAVFEPGYNLSAGRKATLKYNGSLSLGNGHLVIQFKPGQKYEIMVIGTGCAFASINVTAS